VKLGRSAFAVFVVVVVGMLSVHLGLKLGTSDGEKQAIAAWVQAVGSIAAICAGAWFIHYQSLLGDQDRIRGILAIIDVSIAAMLDDREIPDTDLGLYNRFTCLNPNRIAYAFENLKAIPLYELRSVEVVHALSDAVETYREFAVSQRDERGVSGIAETRIEHKAASYSDWHERLTNARDRVAKKLL